MLRTGRRATLIVLLLLLAVAATTVLAYQAQQAARSHREAAERVLDDYAAFAGWELSRVARRALYDTLNMELSRLACLFENVGDVVAPPLASAECCGTMAWRPRAAFRIRGPEATIERTGALSDAVAGRLAALYETAQRDREHYDCPMFAVDWREDEASLLVWRVLWNRRGEPDGMVGFEADVDRLPALFTRVLADSPLLPPSLAAPADANRLLSVRVTSADGRELFASSPEWSPYASEEPLETALGGLRLAVALRPDAAADLVIGGLPQDRLPLLVGLLALTVGLVLVAIVQFRREQDLARLRTDFVSGVSHELRTPLAQIRLFADTLLLGRVRSRGEERRSLEAIRRESERLTELVENVLVFSRAEHRTLAVSRAWHLVAPLVADVVQSFEPIARARGVRIACDPLAGVEAELDAGAFRQVLLNLLDNAVKYGPSGGRVVVGVARHDDGVRVWVDDEGPGIAPDDRERIWDPFCRLARAESAHVGGSGIGLAIVRELVSLHGGRAWAEASPEGGARFVVLFPNARAAEVRSAPAVAPAVESRVPA